MSLQAESDQGRDARSILDSPAYQEAMKRVRQNIIAQWEACPVRDKEGQTLLLQLIKLSTLFEGILSGMVETGKLADVKLDEMRDESVIKRHLRKII